MKAFRTDCVKWVSLEPMLEPIQFDSLDWCDLMVIGAQSSTNQPEGHVPEFAPAFDWVVDVVNQCREALLPEGQFGARRSRHAVTAVRSA